MAIFSEEFKLEHRLNLLLIDLRQLNNYKINSNRFWEQELVLTQKLKENKHYNFSFTTCAHVAIRHSLSNLYEYYIIDKIHYSLISDSEILNLALTAIYYKNLRALSLLLELKPEIAQAKSVPTYGSLINFAIEHEQEDCALVLAKKMNKFAFLESHYDANLRFDTPLIKIAQKRGMVSLYSYMEKELKLKEIEQFVISSVAKKPVDARENFEQYCALFQEEPLSPILGFNIEDSPPIFGRDTSNSSPSSSQTLIYSSNDEIFQGRA